jgi:hypothetical protein
MAVVVIIKKRKFKELAVLGLLVFASLTLVVNTRNRSLATLL